LKVACVPMPTSGRREFLDVDPRILRLPWGRRRGADPVKLARQIALFGTSTDGMPLILVTRDKNGLLGINDGATRATRIAKLLPGQSVRVEVLETRPTYDFGRLPTVGDTIQPFEGHVQGSTRGPSRKAWFFGLILGFLRIV
jgi:hypothetical protein